MSVIIINESVLARLATVLEESGMSQKEFARIFKQTPGAITELRSGRTKNISKTIIEIIVLKLGVNPKWLSTGRGEKFCPVIEARSDLEVDIILTYRQLSQHNKVAFNVIIKSLIEEQKSKEGR